MRLRCETRAFLFRGTKKSAGGQLHLQRSKGAQICQNAPLLLFYNDTNAQRLHNIMQHVHAYRHVSAFNAYNMPNRKPGLFRKTIQGPPAFCTRFSDHMSHGGRCCFSSLFFCHIVFVFCTRVGSPPPTLRPTLLCLCAIIYAVFPGCFKIRKAIVRPNFTRRHGFTPFYSLFVSLFCRQVGCLPRLRVPGLSHGRDALPFVSVLISSRLILSSLSACSHLYPSRRRGAFDILISIYYCPASYGVVSAK